MSDRPEDQDPSEVGLPPLDGDAYRVPTNPCEATLVLPGGEREAVTIFLAPHSRLHSGQETVDEFLDSGRDFLPVRGAERGSFLVNRESLLCLEVGPEAPTSHRREETAGGALEIVRVELEGGVEVEGALRMLGPEQSRRVSDLFNETGRFLPLESKSGTVYLNKRRALRVSF